MAGLLWESHFLASSPLKRNEENIIVAGLLYFSSHARNEEDIIVSRVEGGDWTVCCAGEGGGSSPEMPQTLQSSKKLQNDSFSKLFVRISRGGGSARALNFLWFSLFFH